MGKIDDPTLYRDIYYIFGKYAKRQMIIDLAANLPIFIYTLMEIQPKYDQDWHISDIYEQKTFIICFNLVHLRLYHFRKVFNVIQTIFDELAEVFYTYKFTLSNIFSWTVAGTSLVVFLHYFACGWTYIANRKKMIGYNHYHDFGDWESFVRRYVDSWYLMTTTISTVGYGDFKGYYDNDGHWAQEMTYLIIVILAGLNLFSLITNEIFSYKTMKTVGEMMREKAQEMEIFMYDISLLRKDKVIEPHYIDMAVNGIKYQIRDSTYHHFEANQYF